MPQISLEYTNNISEKIEPRLFLEIHQMLVKHANAELMRCKSRAIKYEQYTIGDGNAENAFIHLTILLAEGRTLHTRQEVGKRAREILRTYFSDSLSHLKLQITVYCPEFSNEVYFL